MKKILAIFALLTLMGVTACSSDGYTDNSMTTLRYEKGSTQGGAFVECISPGEKIVTNDKLYPYPNTQREDVWDTANYNQGSNSADHPDLEVVDKDGVRSFVKLKVSFFLNTDCSPVEAGGKRYEGGTLQAFHELIGKTRGAYFNEDGSYNDGWLWAMDNYISSSVTDFMVKAAREPVRNAESMWLNASTSTDMQEGLAEALPGLVNAGMETDLQFYRNFTVKIYSITPEQEYLDIFKERQSAKSRAETAEYNKQAKIAEAEAKAAVARAEADVKRAEISGYGSFENYKENKMVENGLNPDQPTYVVGGVTR